MRSAFYIARRIFVAMAAIATVGATSAVAQWTQRGSLPLINIGSMNAYHNGYLYIFGGGGIQVGGSRFDVLSESWKIDVATGQRTAIAPLPEARRFGYAAEANGKIYILGGMNGPGGAFNLLTSILEYDPATNNYVTKAQLPRPMIQGAGASVSTKIFLIGGLTIGAQDLENSSAVQMYDVLTNTVVEMNPAPFAGEFATAASNGSGIILVGGSISGVPHSVRNQAYQGVINGSSITWMQIANYPQAIYGGIPGQIAGKVYITGGYTAGGGISNRTYSYNWRTNQWDANYAYDMPIATAAVNSMPGPGDKFYLAGGVGNDKVYKFELGAIADLGIDLLLITTKAGQQKQSALTLRNAGVARLSGTLTIAAEAQEWLQTQMSNFTVQPGTKQNLVFNANATALAPGAYSTDVTITTNDPNFVTTTIRVRLYVIPADVQAQPSRVVVEAATGAWMGRYGTDGVLVLRALKAQYRDRIIMLCYHDRGGRGPTVDTMGTYETEVISNLLDMAGFPSAAFNRLFIRAHRMIGTNYWSAAPATVLEQMPEAPVSLKIDRYEYNAATRTVTASLKIKAIEALMVTGVYSFNVTGVVTEDSIKSPQEGIAENPFYHMDVARDFWPSIHGREISVPAEATAEAETVLLPNYEFTVPVSFVVDNVANPRNGHVTFLIHRDTTDGFGPILNADQIKLTDTITGDSGQASYDIQTPTSYILDAEKLQLGLNAPNPVSGTTTFEFVSPRPGVVSVDVFSMSGELVMSLPARIVERGAGSFQIDASNLPNGIYSIRLTANGASVQRTITVFR